jgi:putative ABC transport system permease protein
VACAFVLPNAAELPRRLQLSRPARRVWRVCARHLVIKRLVTCPVLSFGTIRSPVLRREAVSFLAVAIGNLRRRAFRSLLTACGIALGVGAFISLVGFAQSFEVQWLQLYRARGTDLCVVRGNFLRALVDESLGEELRSLSVVADASPFAYDLIDFTQEVTGIVQGWQDTSFELESFTILQGRRFRGDEPGIMLGEVLADTIGKKAGDDVDVLGVPLRVVAVYRGVGAPENSGAVVPLHQLQRISDLGSKVAGFNVRLRPPPQGESAEQWLVEARQLIESRLPGLKAVPVGDLVRKNYIVSAVQSTAWGISTLALALGALGIANTMTMSVVERTREIGILRALGWRRSRIVRLILLEASMLGLGGGLAGVAAGHAGLVLLASNRVAPGMAQARFSLPLSVEALVIAVGISVAAGLLPVHRGNLFSPVEALRHE